ncbi:uncharacterized protein VTP21DRAFT_2917 [Calcarisporiella thermophila]|uniref:uncharacterized protein n=1 Tax=Calcarisporiella thermophila TaxID=911321 RepID=UPI0037445D09
MVLKKFIFICLLSALTVNASHYTCSCRDYYNKVVGQGPTYVCGQHLGGDKRYSGSTKEWTFETAKVAKQFLECCVSGKKGPKRNGYCDNGLPPGSDLYRCVKGGNSCV